MCLSMYACDDDYLCAFDANVYYFFSLFFSEVFACISCTHIIISSLNLMFFPFYLICRLISDRTAKERRKRRERGRRVRDNSSIHEYIVSNLDQKREWERKSERERKEKLEFVPEIKRKESVSARRFISQFRCTLLDFLLLISCN